MLAWLIVLLIISLISGFFTFGNFSYETTILAEIIFLTFTVLFLVGLFVYLGTKKAIKK